MSPTKFTVDLSLENVAMEDQREVARILRDIASKLEDAPQSVAVYSVRDCNGNKVGTWGYQK